MMLTVSEIKEAIRAKSRELGFDAVGFASTEADPGDARNLEAYLRDGRHGDMSWMEATSDRRADPRALWPEARSVIVCGLNYGPAGDPRAQIQHRNRGAISVYAQGRDYHKVLIKRLKQLGGWIVETYDCEVKVFTDTAPVMEKPLAARAGLGWIGKHTNLVSRRFGSWLFLGEVFTTLELPPDAPGVDHCGSCDRCLRACPTGALPEPYRIDPRRCVSYLTIEHKGPIDEELRPAIANRVYGCDDCLAVCPWNTFSMPAPHADFVLRAELAEAPLAALAELDEPAFREMFKGSAAKRTGRDRFVRNVIIAIGNSADATLGAVARSHLEDASMLVRDAARWAIDRLKANPADAQPTEVPKSELSGKS